MVDRAVDWLNGRNEKITAAQLDHLCILQDRNRGPATVYDFYCWNLITTEVLRPALLHVWLMAEHPEVYVERAWWLECFDQVGYTIDAQPAGRPTKPVQLYRGAIPKHARGMSWTRDLELATWFADRERNAYLRPAEVFVATVAPRRMLAEITATGFGRGGESEVIIDPRRMSYRAIE